MDTTPENTATSSPTGAVDKPALIIHQISELKSAGVWKSFSNKQAPCLKPKTLIYGLNGTGKTTLSRILSSIQRAELESNLPRETVFKVKTSDQGEITQKTIENPSKGNPFGSNLLVFNEDFVKRNFAWDKSHAKGIVYIDTKKVEVKREYDQVSKDLEEAKRKEDTAQESLGAAEQEIKKFRTRVANDVRTTALSKTPTQTYDAKKIRDHYSKRAFDATQILSNDELTACQDSLRLKDPLPKLSFDTELPHGFVDWFQSSLKTLQSSIPSLARAEFDAHKEALIWLEAGFNYQKNHNLTDCLLCGNEFSEDRKNKLESLFDTSWKDAVTKIKTAVSEAESHLETLKEYYTNLPKVVEISPDQEAVYKDNRQALGDAIKEIGNCTKVLLSKLQEKANNPTEAIFLTGLLENFDVHEWAKRYEVAKVDIHNTLAAHNKTFDEFETIQNAAFSKIEAHVLATRQEEWDTLFRARENKTKECEDAATLKNRLEERQVSLKGNLESTGLAADELNTLLQSYLGHTGLRLSNADGGYEIVRENNEPAKHLSEGERKALVFCYFLTQLKAEDRRLKDLVVVIDDPVSSLDTSARSHALSLITRITKKCAQVIILTHNVNFMNMVKRGIKPAKEYAKEDIQYALLELECRNPEGGQRSTALVDMNPLLANYDSEYHYLFNLVQKAVEQEQTDFLYLLPNATRKLLEMFLTFCSPGQQNFADALGNHSDNLKNKVDVRALEVFVQTGSHGSIEGMGNLPDLTIEKARQAAKAAMSFIEGVAPNHYKRMETVCKSKACKI